MGHKGSKKGFVSIPATDPKTGAKFFASVPVNSGIAKKYRAQVKKIEKENRKAFREFKDNMRLAKKALPADMRAKVNWREVEIKTEEVEVMEPIA